MKKLKVAVIGPGRWGTCIAWLLSSISEKVYLVGIEKEENFEFLKRHGRNSTISLKDNVILTTNIQEAFDYASDFICIAINGQSWRKLLEDNVKLFKKYKGIIVFQSKTLEKRTGKTPSQVYKKVIGRKDNYTILVGPAHPVSLVKGEISDMVISGTNRKVVEEVAKKYRHKLFKIRINYDLIGVELCCALKNVIGIMSGIIFGLKKEWLLKSLVVRAIAEVMRLVSFYGGDPLTVTGVTFLGDLFVTAIFPECEASNNFKYGKWFVTGEGWNIEKVAEGVPTLESLHVLTDGFTKVEMPLHQALFELFKTGNGNIEKELKRLFDRPLKEEFWGIKI